MRGLGFLYPDGELSGGRFGGLLGTSCVLRHNTAQSVDLLHQLLVLLFQLLVLIDYLLILFLEPLILFDQLIESLGCVGRVLRGRGGVRLLGYGNGHIGECDTQRKGKADPPVDHLNGSRRRERIHAAIFSMGFRGFTLVWTSPGSTSLIWAVAAPPAGS